MYKFVYQYENFIQEAFDGHKYKVRGYRGEGHVVIESTNVTLCGVPKEDLKDGVANVATLEHRLGSVKLCPKCQAKWKEMPDSPWKKWAESVL